MRKLTLTLIILFPFFWANGQTAESFKKNKEFTNDTTKIEKKLVRDLDTTACPSCVLETAVTEYKKLIKKYNNLCIYYGANAEWIKKCQSIWEEFTSNSEQLYCKALKANCTIGLPQLQFSYAKQRCIDLAQLYLIQKENSFKY